MKYNPMRSHSIARISLAVIVAIILTLVLIAYANQAEAKGVTTAQIRMMDGSVVEGVTENSYANIYNDVVTVVIDGVTYRTHFSNVILVAR